MNGADTLSHSDNDCDGHQDQRGGAFLLTSQVRAGEPRGHDCVAGVLGGICRAHDASSGRDCFAPIEIAWYFLQRDATRRQWNITVTSLLSLSFKG
jgi:hypothetical protein